MNGIQELSVISLQLLCKSKIMLKFMENKRIQLSSSAVQGFVSDV